MHYIRSGMVIVGGPIPYTKRECFNYKCKLQGGLALRLLLCWSTGQRLPGCLKDRHVAVISLYITTGKRNVRKVGFLFIFTAEEACWSETHISYTNLLVSNSNFDNCKRGKYRVYISKSGYAKHYFSQWAF